MAIEAPHKPTPLAATTRRGFATASFSFGVWGMLVFWWYPFGMAIAALGVVFGVISLLFGIRAGKDGENLAAYGVVFGLIGVSLAIGVYRFVQTAFEGAPTADWLVFPYTF